MAISTIGNITYINQNMQTTSAAHANAMQKPDTIPQEFQDKLREIQEVRKTETDNAINKDARGNQDWQEPQEQKEKKHDQEEEKAQDIESNEQGKPSYPRHLLNIKV